MTSHDQWRPAVCPRYIASMGKNSGLMNHPRRGAGRPEEGASPATPASTSPASTLGGATP